MSEEKECKCECHDRPPGPWDVLAVVAASIIPVAFFVSAMMAFKIFFEVRK